MKKIFHKDDHVKLLDNLSAYINNLTSQNEYLQEKLNNFRKDDEIQKLEEENKQLRSNSLTVFTDKQRVDAREFSQEHYKKCKSNIIYIVEGTGLGESVQVQCKKCKEIKNITDISNW
jgi:hypothetical protein